MQCRIEQQNRERNTLSRYAAYSDVCDVRTMPEEPCPTRTCFQRDIDRITHSKAFRRLMHKTQMFLKPEGDHYRTRLTHTLEVARIARTMARALRLNEDLAEAIALGHDLGHTPFGHTGEDILNEVMPGGFTHNAQSLRVVEVLEKDGQGLNLTEVVRNGIQHHSGGTPPVTLEGRLVHKADRIAYINHDIDDALRGGLLKPSDLPGNCIAVLGDSHSTRINTLISDVIENSFDKSNILMSPRVETAMLDLRQFLFDNVYLESAAKDENAKAQSLVKLLFNYYIDRPEVLPDEYDKSDVSRGACDYIAGMTDQFAVSTFRMLFEPQGWEA
ncbi:MAG: deoxyguanosinetriphosphate triphosphohydrolase [Oscillospiraceae bacterium]|nr:deoxyguanosinetriphosphate triphosphohydrolase [Oscillospiraceae bacterium]